jgi:hypothetical protein
MRYDAADRILSFSFARDPEEHAAAMMEAGHRLVAPIRRVSPWRPFFIMIGIGVITGAAMELYRRYLLPPLLGTSDVASLPMALLVLLPLMLIAAALIVAYLVRAGIRQHNAIVARLDPKMFIDVDIFKDGIRVTSGPLTMDIDWPGVHEIVSSNRRIDLEAEGYVVYIPERAFADRAAFARGAADIRKLWRNAVRHDRDSRMIEAGLD